MDNAMLTNEANVADVHEEDRMFIRDIRMLTNEKKLLIRGILIGMKLQENQAGQDAVQKDSA